ncbi:MAG: penicillin-binding protein 2 [Nitrospiraceae bacterium]|nr:penicillin-binding protein 2 [Nitrospiraceae bacterium]
MLTEKAGTEKIARAGIFIVLGFLLLLIRLWQLQILQGDDLRKISESNRLRVFGVPAPRGIIFDRNGVPLVKNTSSFCASLIPEEFDRNLIPALARMLKIPEEELARRIERPGLSPFAPVRLKEDLSFNEVSYIEARRSDFPGLMIEIEVSRQYIYGSVGAHVIGYLGKLSPNQAKDPAFRDVPPEAFIGQWGVEKIFDRTLRGTAGQRIIEVDALGREIRLLKENPPVKGQDLTLSIDIALQKEAEAAFEGKTGALVALKPGTGEVLGLVSAPSFDPNMFAKGISSEEWTALMKDKRLPMLDRAVQSQYPPGSTFKVIMSIAGLAEGVIDEDSTVTCRGGLNFGKWHFGCWRKTGHGTVSLHRAFIESCDVYYYELGKKLGIDRIYDYATRFGLGKETGFLLGSEKKGLIPNTKWKLKTKKAPWFLGETFVNSIGQGYVAATPLQMAVMMGAVSNGGTVYRPLLIKDETPVVLRKADVRPEILEEMKRHLAGVVNEPGGTGGAARSGVTVIGGKTGTAQVVSLRKDSKSQAEHRDHAWFVATAPVDDPKIVISVMVEHGGHGGSAAGPIARRAIEAYMLPPEKKKELTDVQN